MKPDEHAVALSPPPPMPARTVVSGDADELAEHLSAWDQTYEQLTSGRFTGRLDELWLDGLQLFRERTSLDVLETGTPWRGSRTFGIPLVMEGAAIYCGKSMPPDMLLTLGPRDALDLRAPRALDIVGMAWPAEALSAFTLDLEGIDLEEELRGRRLLPVAPAALARLRCLLREVFMLLDEDAARLADPQVARGLRCTLLETVVAAVRDAAGEPAETFTASVRHATVRRARDYALSRPDEPPSVAELCAALRVSRRTLQTCFNDMLGMSPHQYLRALRLNGMRRELRSEADGRAAVHEIAARWGFWHMSSCAADYRRLFGELPSATLRAARHLRDGD